MKKFVTFSTAMNRILEDDNFLSELADELLLDEVLCGEADPKQFLVDSIKSVRNKSLIKHHERRVSQLKSI